MKLMLVLSKQNILMSKQEATNLIELKKPKLDENILIGDTEFSELFPRLAYTKTVLQYLFDCKTSELAKCMKSFDWNSVYEKNFCLRIFGSDEYKEAKLAGHIWNSVKNPKVNLDNPKTQFELHFTGKRVYCGKLLWENTEKFEDRRAHLRPELMPTSLHPRLARALVNLTGAKGSETIIDPFCGTGGILMEAGLMRLNAAGSDINPIIVRKCLLNLKHYKLKIAVTEQDALKAKGKYDYFATDLPYGKNTGRMNLEKLYSAFLKKLKKTMKKRAVVVFPGNVKYKPLIRAAKLKIESEFSHYIHKSMTKKIVVLH